jgi:hypothetical protein
VWPAFLARLSDAGFDPVAQDIAFELGILPENRKMPIMNAT